MNSQHKVEQLAQENQALKTELALFQSRCEQYAQAYDSLKSQIVEMQRHRFGKRSERYIDSENPQLSLFQDNNDLPSKAESTLEQTQDATTVAAHTRKKKTKKDKRLPHRIEIIPLPDEDKQCECGACKTVIRYEAKELLNYQPCVIEIVEQRREVAACPRGCDIPVIIEKA